MVSLFSQGHSLASCERKKGGSPVQSIRPFPVELKSLGAKARVIARDSLLTLNKTTAGKIIARVETSSLHCPPWDRRKRDLKETPLREVRRWRPGSPCRLMVVPMLRDSYIFTIGLHRGRPFPARWNLARQRRGGVWRISRLPESAARGSTDTTKGADMSSHERGYVPDGFCERIR